MNDRIYWNAGGYFCRRCRRLLDHHAGENGKLVYHDCPCWTDTAWKRLWRAIKEIITQRKGD